MTYQEALRIGTKAQGTIKATYAELYDENGKKLFSIQKKQPRKYVQKLYDEKGKFIGNDEYTQQYVQLTEDGMDYSLDLAIVEAYASELSTDKLVPCYLLYDTYVYLKAAIEASRKYPFTEEREVERDGKTIIERVDSYVYGDKYNYLLQKMESQVLSGEPFYVKPLAFDWHPVAINKEEVEEQKKEFDKTKLLALAAVAVVLCGK